MRDVGVCATCAMYVLCVTRMLYGRCVRCMRMRYVGGLVCCACDVYYVYDMRVCRYVCYM